MPPDRVMPNPNENQNRPIGHKSSKLDLAQTIRCRPPQPAYILPGLRRRRLGILTSPGGVGKSFVSLTAAIQLAAGTEVLGGVWGPVTSEGIPVVYMALEDDLEDIALRVHSIAAELGIQSGEKYENLIRNLVICDSEILHPVHEGCDNGLIFPVGLDGTPVNPSLLIIDTLSRYLGPDIDENNSTAMTHVIKDIEYFLKKWNAAGLLIHHAAKDAMSDHDREIESTASQARGSGAITFAARAAWTLWPPTRRVYSERMRNLQAHNRDAREDDRDQFLILTQIKRNYGRKHAQQWMRRNSEGVPVPIPTPESAVLRSPLVNRSRIGSVLHDEPTTDIARG
ncbi:MAG: AAA family ATPase [Luteolibacter sp.]